MTNRDDTDSVIELRLEGQMPIMACARHEVDGYQETIKEQVFFNVGATHASPLLSHHTDTIRVCK